MSKCPKRWSTLNTLLMRSITDVFNKELAELEEKGRYQEMINKNQTRLEDKTLSSSEKAKIDKRENALSIIKDAINFDKNNGTYRYFYGLILLKFGDYEAAAEQFIKAIEVELKSEFLYKFYVNLGQCCIELSQYEKALINIKNGKKIAEERNIDKWIKKVDIYIS